MELNYLDFVMGSNDITYEGWHSFTSRKRPTDLLEQIFRKCTASLFDINRHENELLLVLTDFDVDREGKIEKRRGKKLRKYVKYEATPETEEMERGLKFYN